MRRLGELGGVRRRRELAGKANALGVCGAGLGMYAEHAVEGIDQVDRGRVCRQCGTGENDEGDG
jgi:hypothetical protein